MGKSIIFAAVNIGQMKRNIKTKAMYLRMKWVKYRVFYPYYDLFCAICVHNRQNSIQLILLTNYS